MLVLGRRPGQKVVFPGLGISVEVMRSQGRVTRLGIEAPADVQVLRDEILDQPGERPVATAPTASPQRDRTWQHSLRNQLNQLTLKLQVLQRQLELGRADQPDQQLADVLASLSDLEQATADAPPPERTPRVLVVEDQANERELLASCLRLWGVEVTTVNNGREAFDYLHEHDVPDLVLLDMRMPELDGQSLVGLIRDDIRLHDLRVFAVSGSARHEFASTLPIDGWFPKPVRVDALVAAIRHPHRAASRVRSSANGAAAKLAMQ